MYSFPPSTVFILRIIFFSLKLLNKLFISLEVSDFQAWTSMVPNLQTPSHLTYSAFSIAPLLKNHNTSDEENNKFFCWEVDRDPSIIYVNKYRLHIDILWPPPTLFQSSFLQRQGPVWSDYVSICLSLLTNYCGIPWPFSVGFDEVFKMLSSYKVSEKLKGWPERKVEAGDLLLWNIIKSTWVLTFESQTIGNWDIKPIAGRTPETFSQFLFLFGCLLVCTFARTKSLL